jgi:dTDP-L-rhamnose 4-epimerase
MRVLVTGGAGFIGSHVVDELVTNGADVLVLDRAPRPAFLPEAVTYVQADVTSTDAWERALPGVDAICHQAARVGLGLRASDVTGYVADNDAGTAAGLWAMDAAGFRGRLVLASSMVVYGEGRYRCEEHGEVRPGRRDAGDLDAGRFEPRCPTCGRDLAADVVPEGAPTDPRNVYAATKLHQEHLCGAVGAEIGVEVTALRYHNVYGPRMPRDTPYAGVASIFRSAIARGHAPRVFEDGGQRRDFVHVTDVAHANVLALTTAEPVPGAFNVCSGEPRTVGELAETLSEALGGPPPIVTGEWRIGDVRHIVASPEAARTRLGFDASVRFADGITALYSEAPLVPQR